MANKPETALYRALTFPLLASHAGKCSCTHAKSFKGSVLLKSFFLFLTHFKKGAQ